MSMVLYLRCEKWYQKSKKYLKQWFYPHVCMVPQKISSNPPRIHKISYQCACVKIAGPVSRLFEVWKKYGYRNFFVYETISFITF